MTREPEDPDGETVPSRDDTSVRLLNRYRDGDAGALEELLKRQLQPVRAWAHGRLPRWARDDVNTEDIVQDVLVRTVARLKEFEPRNDGAVQWYLRRAVLHRIHDEIRRKRRTPDRKTLDSAAPTRAPSPHDEAEAVELFAKYEEALARLRDPEREAIVLRVEMELPYREIARILGKPSEAAAQMAVARALVHLAREMGRDS